MKYFSKEYIKEADCEEIQGLRPVLIDSEDYTKGKRNNLISIVKSDKLKIGGLDNQYIISCKQKNKEYWASRKEMIWLPTGDQLDEEIVKICRKRKYEYAIFYSEDKCIATIEPITPLMEGLKSKEFIDLNPYIAKIKLLKQLLKELEER